jgi:hypothetical protein
VSRELRHIVYHMLHTTLSMQRWLCGWKLHITILDQRLFKIPCVNDMEAFVCVCVNSQQCSYRDTVHLQRPRWSVWQRPCEFQFRPNTVVEHWVAHLQYRHERGFHDRHRDALGRSPPDRSTYTYIRQPENVGNIQIRFNDHRILMVEWKYLVARVAKYNNDRRRNMVDHRCTIQQKWTGVHTINGAGGTDGRFGYGDRTFDAIYLGRSRTNTGHLNGDIAGAFIVDELLTIDATTVIANDMVNGMDLTDTTCPSGNTCTVCPADSTSPTGSTQITSCTCNQGYTGLNGGPCTACPVGTYKQNSGSAAYVDYVAGKYSILTVRLACTDCVAGTYSPTVAATSAAACLACPANANSPAGSTAAASCTCNVGFAFSNNVCVCALGYQTGA